MAKQFKEYHLNLVARVRSNFDALLQMFLNHEGAQAFLGAHVGMWEMRQRHEEQKKAKKTAKANSMTPTNANPMIPTVNIRAIQTTIAIIDEDAVDTLFIKGDMQLVSDVWYPILDVVEDEYLEKNTEWADRMLKRTCIILSLYITYYLNSSDPRAWVGKESGAGSVIEVEDKTLALKKTVRRLADAHETPKMES